MRASGQPDAHALHARLLARALVAPGAEGRGQVAEVLEEIAPFARVALDKGFGDAPRKLAFAHASEAGTLRGTLDGAHRPGLLRVVLRPDGLHGGHAVRHGLEALCASLLEQPQTLYELVRPGRDEEPSLIPHKPIATRRAAAALESLFAWHDAAVRAPLAFLPKSAHAYVRCLGEKGEASAMNKARDTWMGSPWQADRAEATAATRVALRGRDPFYDGDEASQSRFVALAQAVFRTLDEAKPLDAELLA
jgi:exodeoxyribonuclease V gamma subunit